MPKGNFQILLKLENTVPPHFTLPTPARIPKPRAFAVRGKYGRAAKELSKSRHVENSMLTEYIEAAMRHATYEILPEDKSYYGEIPECRGVWANEPTLEETREDLRSTLEDWILLGLQHGAKIPVIDGIDINLKEDAVVWAD